MIRTTAEASFFGLWREAARIARLAHPSLLTTGRYEPILRRQQGSGHLDLLFESESESCVIGAIRLEAAQLISRERSAFIWPAHIAEMLDTERLSAIERAVVPWLRAIARGRPMSAERIRRFGPSARFDRAREAGLVGATPLERAVVTMAPFVYARRFAVHARVRLGGPQAPLAHAVLADVAAVIEHDDASAADAFAYGWYGVTPVPCSTGAADIVLTERRHDAGVAIRIVSGSAAVTPERQVEIPLPVPWDLLFSFDSADAPSAGSFSVLAAESPLRPVEPLTPGRPTGGSSGSIALAVSAEAFAMRGADIDEVERLGRALAAEGIRAHLSTEISDPALKGAQLVHIFGSPCEPHTLAFAEMAIQRGIQYVFDLPPKALDPSGYLEHAFAATYRTALDNADLARYLVAFESAKLDPVGLTDPTPADLALNEARFLQLAATAAAIIALEEDVAELLLALPPAVAERVNSRGVFDQSEPEPAPVGHLVPNRPFVFMHTTLAVRSNALFAAIAAQRAGVPIVIAGPVYDVDYLHLLRGSAPHAIVLADAGAGVVSALYRRADLWIDPAPRPRSAAGLMRAVACGALPVLSAESPLLRIAGSNVPSFAPRSCDDCAGALVRALASGDHEQRILALQRRLSSRRDFALTFSNVMRAYANATVTH